MMKFSRIFKFFRHGSIRGHFSQCGEDVILHKLFGSKYSEGFYVDVGAHHPFRQSNTAYLWLLGWNGVNVDANKRSIEIFNKVRKNDINICAAIVDEETKKSNPHITLHSNHDLDLSGTCDTKLASERATSRQELVQCMTLAEVINIAAEKNYGKIDFLNIDIEGFDEVSIETIATWNAKPQVICIEIYKKNIREVLESKAAKILEAIDYVLIGRVGPTAIFQRLD